MGESKKEWECERGRQTGTTARKTQIRFQAGKESFEEIRLVLCLWPWGWSATSLESCCLMFAGRSLSATVSSHLFLLVSLSLFFSLFHLIFLSLCLLVWHWLSWTFAYPALPDFLPFSLSVIFSVSDRSDCCCAYLVSFISSLSNSTVLSLSLSFPSPVIG